MEHICVICDDDPTSHSCHILDKPSTNIKIVYTCPSRATKYYDTKGTVAHYKNVLKIIGEQDWEYVCDCTDFGLKHAMCINTATNIVKLIVEKYYKNLKKININGITYDDTVIGNNMHAVKNEIKKEYNSYIEKIPETIIKKYDIRT